MKKKIIVTGTIALTLFIGGCFSMGNKVLEKETSQAASTKIIHGKTTKSEIRAMYGDPMETNYTDSGNEVWKYHFTKNHMTVGSFIPVASLFASGSKGKKKELVLFFDQKGIVKRHSMSASNVETNTSLIQ